LLFFFNNISFIEESYFNYKIEKEMKNFSQLNITEEELLEKNIFINKYIVNLLNTKEKDIIKLTYLES